VHTAGVVVENDTTRPDEAVATTVTGVCASVLAPGLTKEIVWLTRVIENVLVRCGAGAYRLSPA
jgi:hypothetical protein